MSDVSTLRLLAPSRNVTGNGAINDFENGTNIGPTFAKGISISGWTQQ